MSGQFGTNWLDLSSTSNRYIQTYYKGFVDISGGPLYVRNNNLFVQGGDISLNGRFYGAGDASLNGNLSMASDLTVGGNLYVKAYTTKQMITELSYQLIVAQDLSVNGRLFLSNDASINNRLFIGSDSSFGGRLFVAGDVSLNGNVFVTTQASTDNSNKVATTAYVKTALSSVTGASAGFTGDVSINNRLYVGSDASLQGNLYVGLRTINNGDISANARLYVGSSLSTGGRLFVGNDVSVNGNLYLPYLNSYPLLGSASITTSSFGQTWTSLASRNTGNYLGPAISSTGQYQVVSNLYSSNYGQTWANATVNPVATLGCTAISADGKYSIGITNEAGGNVYYSSDFGQTYNASNLNVSYYGPGGLAMSATGQYCVIGKYTHGPVVVYYSSNYGQTWTATATSPSTNGGFRPAAISGDGTRLLVGNGSYGGMSAASGIWYSSNAGTTWTQANLSNVVIIDIKMSYTGQYCIASKSDGIYYSSDYGVTWTLSTSSPANSELTLDKTGQYGLATSGFEGTATGVYYTTNYGQTWTLSNQTTGTFHVALSSNGIYGIAVSKNSNIGIYLQTNPSTTATVGGIINVSGGLMANDISANSRLFVTSNSILGGTLTVSQSSILSGDVSMNQRLYVGSDASFGGNLFVNLRTVQNGDASMNNRLYVGSDVSLGSRLFVASTITANNGLSVTGTVTLPNASIADAALSSNIVTLAGSQTLTNKTITTSGLLNALADTSLNQRLFVAGDVSLNSRLYVGSDVTLKNRLSINGDISFNGSLSSAGGTLYLNNVSAVISDPATFGFTTLNRSSYSIPGLTGIVCSNTGQYIVLYDMGNTAQSIYLSSNYGTSLNQITSQTFSSTYIYGAAISSDGSKISIITSGGVVYYSINYGVNWTTGATISASALSGTSDFTKLYAYGSGGVYLSTNYGSSFSSISTTINNSSSVNSRVFKMNSSNGQYGIAYFNSNIYFTSNSGVTWSISSGLTNIVNGSHLGISANGQYAIVNNNGGTTSSFFYSNNYCQSFNQSTIPNSSVAGITTLSSSGKFGISGKLVTSDYGKTWTTSSSIGTVYSQGFIMALVISENELYSFYSFATGTNYLWTQQNSTTTVYNSTLSITGDISLNSRLYVTNDISANGRLLLGSDIFLGGKLNVVGDSSLNGNLSLANDLTVGGNLYVKAYTTKQMITELSYQLIVAQDLSVNGRLFLSNDASINNRLFVGSDASFGGNLYSSGKVTAGAGLAVTGSVTLPSASVSDSALSSNIVTLAGSQTLTNKTLTGPVISTITNSGTITVPTGNFTLATLTGTETLTNKTITTSGLLNALADTSLNQRLYVGADASFGGNLYSSGNITTGAGLAVTGSVTLPAASIADAALSSNIVTLAGSQTLTNKTLTGPVISTITNSGTITVPTGNFTLATLTGTETLTNKTLTSPAISTITNSGTITVPTGNFTLATLTGTETLTNKTIITSGLFNAQSDASLNSRLYVGSDASFGGKMFLVNDASFNGRLYLNSNSLYVNGAIFSGGSSYFATDVSMASRLLVSGDTSMNGNLSMASDLTVGGNLYVKAYTTKQMITELSYQLIVAQDLSVNGRLFLSNDASINNRLFVGSDASFGGKMFLVNDASFNGRLYLNSNSLYVNGAVFSGGSSYFATDVSMASRLFVTNDVSLGGNLYVSKVLKPTTISETFITNTSSSSPYSLDYSTGSTFYITTPPASNFTVNLTNVPSDINQTYVATLIITSTSNKTFCNSLQINGATSITPNYAGGIPSSIVTGNVITQSISIQRISAGDVAANVNVLSSVTAWY